MKTLFSIVCFKKSYFVPTTKKLFLSFVTNCSKPYKFQLNLQINVFLQFKIFYPAGVAKPINSLSVV